MPSNTKTMSCGALISAAVANGGSSLPEDDVVMLRVMASYWNLFMCGGLPGRSPAPMALWSKVLGPDIQGHSGSFLIRAIRDHATAFSPNAVYRALRTKHGYGTTKALYRVVAQQLPSDPFESLSETFLGSDLDHDDDLPCGVEPTRTLEDVKGFFDYLLTLDNGNRAHFALRDLMPRGRVKAEYWFSATFRLPEGAPYSQESLEWFARRQTNSLVFSLPMYDGTSRHVISFSTTDKDLVKVCLDFVHPAYGLHDRFPVEGIPEPTLQELANRGPLRHAGNTVLNASVTAR